MADVLELVGETAVGFPVEGSPALWQVALEAPSHSAFGCHAVPRLKSLAATESG